MRSRTDLCIAKREREVWRLTGLVPQVFIIISGVGVISLFFLLPESKGIPLEEMAAIWGDDPNEIAMLEQTPEAVARQESVGGGEKGESVLKE